jgi:hypothetical protein
MPVDAPHRVIANLIYHPLIGIYPGYGEVAAAWLNHGDEPEHHPYQKK